jgi:hypothetical protein
MSIPPVLALAATTAPGAAPAGVTLYMGASNAGFLAFDISGELWGDLGSQRRIMAQVNNGLFFVRLAPRRPHPGPVVP